MSTKKSLIHIQKYKKVLSAVHMVYRLINSTYNVSELSLRLTRLICQFINASYASVHILNREKKSLELVAIFNNKINILITKKQDLLKRTEQEKRVMSGYVIFEKDFIGIPMVADENIGAIFVQREKNKLSFSEEDKDVLAVLAEQAVTAIKNIQLSEEQHKVILSSVKFIGELLKRHGHSSAVHHTPVYFKIAEAIAHKLKMNHEEIDALYYVSVLRDSGAIDIPYEILAKTSQLTSEEFKIIREYPTKAVELIRPVEFLKPVLPIILYRNEKFDGSGYPSGLKRDQIPLGARVVAVVDAFEAMTRKRAYKKHFSLQGAIEELYKNSGTQFDPKVVNAFEVLYKQKIFRKMLSF